MLTRTLIGLTLLCLMAHATHAQDASPQDADFQARLKAGREAAYKKYLLQPTVTDADHKVKTIAPVRVATVVQQPMQVRMPESSRPIFAGQDTPYAFGDLRYNFYDNLNTTRTQRWSDYQGYPYIYQPLWDSRYRRSWPRPVVIRDYVKSHWLWDGQKYTFVPGHAEYRTEWVTQGWPRYRWNGSHYSVSVSYNR